jgi:hypothetical protein
MENKTIIDAPIDALTTETIDEKLENTKKIAEKINDSHGRFKLARNFIKSCLCPENMEKSLAMSYIRVEMKKAFDLKGDAITELLAYYKFIDNMQNGAKCCTTLADKQKETETETTEEERIDYDEKNISEDRQATAKEEALEILRNGDPIDKILKTISKTHVGDDKFQELMCIAIASQSCLNTAGIQPSLHGSPGSGKSHAMKTHGHMIRAKHKLESTLSAKAPYYLNMKPGCIIICDDSEPSEAMEETIKRATTNFQEITYHSTVNDGVGGSKMIPERLLWLFTSVNNNGSDQLSDRQVKSNTIETKAQKIKACEKQLEEAETGKYGLTDIDDDILICRYIYDEIKSKTLRVKIPFAKNIKFHITDNLRNTQRFLDMIRGYAIMYHMQRVIEDGCVLANELDFEFAYELFNSQLESAVTKLTDKERKITHYIATHEGCTISEISNGTQYTQKVVRDTIKGRPKGVSGGLLEKVTGLTETRETHAERINEEQTISKTADHYYLKKVEGNWELFNNQFVELIIV